MFWVDWLFFCFGLGVLRRIREALGTTTLCATFFLGDRLVAFFLAARFFLGAAFFFAARFLGAAFFFAARFLGAAFFFAARFLVALFLAARFLVGAARFLAARFLGAAFLTARFLGAAFFFARFFFTGMTCIGCWLIKNRQLSQLKPRVSQAELVTKVKFFPNDRSRSDHDGVGIGSDSACVHEVVRSWLTLVVIG